MKDPYRGAAVICLCLLFCPVASMSQDQVIALTKAGKLEGLPPEYQPATFDRASLTLRVKERAIRFPTCLRSTLPTEHFDLVIGGSWRRDSAAVPSYIHLVYSFKKSASDAGTEIWLVFDLDFLTLLSAEIATLEENGWIHRELPLAPGCQALIAKAVFKP